MSSKISCYLHKSYQVPDRLRYSCSCQKKKNLIQLWTKKILKKGKGSGKAKIRRKRRRKKKKEKKRREERVEKKKEEKKKGKKEKEKIKREGKEEENKKKKPGFTDLQLFPQHTVALLG